MARNRTIHPRVRSARKSLWLQFDPITITGTQGTAFLMASLNAAALALRLFTIVRSHLEVLFLSDQAAAVEIQIGALGLAIVSEQANAVGVTAIPTPVTESGSSLWFLHKFLFAQESRVVDVGKPAGQWSIDSKAMRKVEVGSDLIMAVEFDFIGGSGGVQMIAGGRVLIKTN